MLTIVIALAAGVSAPAHRSRSRVYECRTTYTERATGQQQRLAGTITLGRTIYMTPKGRLVLQDATFAFSGFPAAVAVVSLAANNASGDAAESSNATFLLGNIVVSPWVTNLRPNEPRATFSVEFSIFDPKPQWTNWRGDCVQAVA